MEKHVEVARAHRAISWLYAIFTLIFIAALFSDNEISSVLGVVIIGQFFGGLFALHHFTAKGAFARRNWTRRTSPDIAVLMLFGFPVGTLIGIYLLMNSWGSWEA